MSDSTPSPPVPVGRDADPSCAGPDDAAAARTDAALVRRVLAGDADAFDALVARHHARCLRIAVHLVGERADAEDAVQETLLRAYRHLGRYREQDRFGAWLTRILVNQCRTVRARARRQTGPDVDRAAADWWSPAAADAAADDADRQALLAGALAGLPHDQREAVVLRYADQLSYAEMAGATGASVAALKMRVQRACRRLRALLAPTAHDHVDV